MARKPSGAVIMPTYKIPEEKDEREEAPTIDSNWMRHVQLPVNEAILDAVNVGDDVTVTLKAKLNGMEKKDSVERKNYSISLNISEVEVYSDDMGKKAFKKGFKNAY